MSENKDDLLSYPKVVTKKKEHSRQITALSLTIFHKEFNEHDVFHKVQRSSV